MHGKLPRNIDEKLADNEQSHQWLKFGDIEGERESTIVAAQDQTVPFHSIPSMALQPLLGPELPQQTPQFFSVFCSFPPSSYCQDL